MPPKTNWGVKELGLGQFRGLVETGESGEGVDPTQLKPEFAAAALNVDFTPAGLSKRKGKLAYNTAAPAGAVTGLAAYYPQDGGAKILVMAAGASVWADVGRDGVFSGADEILAGVTGSGPTSFCQFRDRLLFSNGTVLPRRWSGSGAAETLANPTAPVNFELTRGYTLLEDFDSDHAGYTSTDTHLTVADLTYGGEDMLLLSATSSAAEGAYAHKVWSAGATVDLSAGGSIAFRAMSLTDADNTLRFGVKNNAGTIVWLGFFSLEQTDVFEEVVLDLSLIEPADRTASTGFAIGWVAKAAGSIYTQEIAIDDAYLVSPLPADTYSYYWTAVDPVRGLESAPTTVLKVTLPVGHQSSSINLLADATPQTGVSEIHLWRHAENSTFAQPKRLVILANPSPATAAITGATNATPIVVTSTGHGLVTGDHVTISGVLGNTAANGDWTITRTSANAFSLDGSVGNGAYTSGGTIQKRVYYEDRRSDADLLIEGAPSLLTLFQIDPPRAKTLAVVRNRLLAGAPTVDGTFYPSRFYLSRYGFPEGMTSSQDPTDPTAGGYFDLPVRDAIVRIVEVDGAAVIFCERSIWTLTGTGWDNFDLKQRTQIGLDAFHGLAVYGSLILFLASDGLRVLQCSFGVNAPFASWVVSEPVGERLRRIPASYRANASCGIDERARLHLSYTAAGATANDAALVLDLRQPGALDRPRDFQRPGWTAYDGWGYSCFETLKRGGGDVGQMIAGDPATGRLWRLQVGADGADLESDSGLVIPWSWSGAAPDHGRGLPAQLCYLAAELDPQPGVSVTLGAVLDRDATSPVSSTVSLGTRTTGIVPLLARTGAKQFRYLQLTISGAHLVRMTVRSLAAGFYP